MFNISIHSETQHGTCTSGAGSEMFGSSWGLVKSYRHICEKVIWRRSIVRPACPLPSGPGTALACWALIITNWRRWYWCKRCIRGILHECITVLMFSKESSLPFWKHPLLTEVWSTLHSSPVLPLALMKGTQYGNSEWRENSCHNMHLIASHRSHCFPTASSKLVLCNS